MTTIQICLIRAWKIIYLKHLSSKIKLPPLFHLVFTYFSFVSILYESWQIDIPMLMCTLEEVCWFLFKMAGCQQSQINILKLDLVCHQIFINDDLHRLIKFVYKTKHWRNNGKYSVDKMICDKIWDYSVYFRFILKVGTLREVLLFSLPRNLKLIIVFTITMITNKVLYLIINIRLITAKKKFYIF